MSGYRQEFDARSEPDHCCARQRQPCIGPQRMPRRPLAGELAECRIFVRRERQVPVILLQNHRDALLLFGSIECPLRNFIDLDCFAVQLPRDQVAVFHSKQPRFFPSHEPVRYQFTREVRVFRRKRLELVQRDAVAHRPWRQRKGTADSRVRADSQPITDPLPSQIVAEQRHPCGYEKKRRLGPQ